MNTVLHRLTFRTLMLLGVTAAALTWLIIGACSFGSLYEPPPARQLMEGDRFIYDHTSYAPQGIPAKEFEYEVTVAQTGIRIGDVKNAVMLLGQADTGTTLDTFYVSVVTGNDLQFYVPHLDQWFTHAFETRQTNEYTDKADSTINSGTTVTLTYTTITSAYGEKAVSIQGTNHTSSRNLLTQSVTSPDNSYSLEIEETLGRIREIAWLDYMEVLRKGHDGPHTIIDRYKRVLKEYSLNE